MTKTDYQNKIQVGKHEMHTYEVWRVLGPCGPEEIITVTGKAALKEAVAGTWDWEAKDLTTGERDIIL